MVITTPIIYNKSALMNLIKGHEIINMLFFDYKEKLENKTYPNIPDIDKILNEFFNKVIIVDFRKQYEKVYEIHISILN